MFVPMLCDEFHLREQISYLSHFHLAQTNHVAVLTSCGWYTLGSYYTERKKSVTLIHSKCLLSANQRAVQ